MGTLQGRDWFIVLFPEPSTESDTSEQKPGEHLTDEWSFKAQRKHPFPMGAFRGSSSTTTGNAAFE